MRENEANQIIHFSLSGSFSSELNCTDLCQALVPKKKSSEMMNLRSENIVILCISVRTFLVVTQNTVSTALHSQVYSVDGT